MHNYSFFKFYDVTGVRIIANLKWSEARIRAKDVGVKVDKALTVKIQRQEGREREKARRTQKQAMLVDGGGRGRRERRSRLGSQVCS